MEEAERWVCARPSVGGSAGPCVDSFSSPCSGGREGTEGFTAREGGCILNTNHTSTLDKQHVALLPPANGINLNMHTDTAGQNQNTEPRLNYTT